MNYERLILASLSGATPKEKYDNLMAIQKQLVILCFPRRGTEDEKITTFDLADSIAPHFHDHVTVVNNPELDFKESV